MPPSLINTSRYRRDADAQMLIRHKIYLPIARHAAAASLLMLIFVAAGQFRR